MNTPRTDTLSSWVGEGSDKSLLLSGGYYAKADNLEGEIPGLSIYTQRHQVVGWCPLHSTGAEARFLEAAHIIDFLLLRGKGPVEIGQFLNAVHMLWPQGEK